MKIKNHLKKFYEFSKNRNYPHLGKRKKEEEVSSGKCLIFENLENIKRL